MHTTRSTAMLDGHEVEYRLRTVKTARRIRIRVGVGGVEIIRPTDRAPLDAEAFLRKNGPWVLSQLDRVARLQSARRVQHIKAGEILYRGTPTPVSVERVPHNLRSNRVELRRGTLVVATGIGSRSLPAQSLERWLRKQARAAIGEQVSIVAARLGVSPRRIYIMDQRTKWGNCSRLRNLSFNWRIVMAPDYVLCYLVTHETVHLAVPDHSPKFWLTVQSLCPEAERARQWLVANGERLFSELAEVLYSPSG